VTARSRVLGALLAVVLALLLLAALNSQPAGNVVQLEQARFSLAPGQPDARLVGLPHRWQDDCPACEIAWYLFEFELAQGSLAPAAVYLPDAVHGVAVYLNGELIGQAAPVEVKASRLHAQPQLYPVDASLWRLGQNTMFVVVRAAHWQRGYLTPLWVGEQATLGTFYVLQQALRQTLARFLGVACLVLGAVLALIWFNRAQQREFGWLALAGVAWSLAQAHATFPFAPVHGATWDAVTAAALAITVLALVEFALRFIELPPRARGLRVFWLLPLLLGVATLWPGSALELGAWAFVYLLLLLAALACWLASRVPEGNSRRWLLIPALLLAVSGAEALATLRALPGPFYNPALLLLMPIVVIGLAWGMMQRFIESLQMAELLNIDLDKLVRDRTVALESQFRRVQALERERAVAHERERLMRDMHDGIGGHLVSTLALLEGGGQPKEEVAGAIRTALDDLRLMIDSLDPVDGDLAAVLAMFRDRIEPRLNAAGLRLTWNIEELPPLTYLGPSSVLSILRILQECVTNTLKHAAACTLRVVAAVEPDSDTVALSVEDDGRGFAPGAVARGRGIRNLERRSEALGGSLQLESGGQGTRITLRLPLHRAPDRDAIGSGSPR
jgi:signal transduction histidine kinase